MTLSILINHRAPIGRIYMTKPEHTRPFNIEHAQAGAPFCCVNGEEVEILKWDRKHTQQIIGLARQDQAIRTWRADGTYTDPNSKAYPLVMTPVAYVEGKPVFYGDTVVDSAGDEFTVPPQNPGIAWTLCTWPKPEPVYPETICLPDELAIAYGNGITFLECLRAVANLAIRRAIEDGQVVRAEDANQQVIDNVIKSGGRNLVPEEMLEKVAQAVAEAAFDHPFVLSAERWSTIIANVKAGRVC